MMLAAIAVATFVVLGPRIPLYTHVGLPAAAQTDISAGLAPEFPTGMQWLNTDRPLTLRGLRGKVVLLDFWTYCCINCMHILPDLHRLETKYRTDLVIIGIHSGKFTEERDLDGIRQAILRYGIEHPVINDNQAVVWNMYGAQAWPTIVLIDPDGKIVYQAGGEGVYDRFDPLISGVITRFDHLGKLDHKPLAFALEEAKAKPTPLFYPGKILADEPGNRLFIADSSHNRVVVSTLDGRVLQTIGSGAPGLALGGNSLYIADTDNHAIRRADLAAGTVTTIAGNGRQAPEFSTGGVGTSTAISSPWDVALSGGTLFIAMSGTHQIWSMDLASSRVQPFAGSGFEGLRDGPLAEASLAQTSGLALDGAGRLYFADPESSSVRYLDLGAPGLVHTIVGQDLYDFGDVDGTGDEVRLQHDLAVAVRDGLLYVADTYNNKIKLINAAGRSSVTFVGSGKPVLVDGAAPSFYQPGGLSIAGNKLFVADTNNHAIRVVDLPSKMVSTLELRGLEPPVPVRPHVAALEPVSLPPARVEPGSGALTVTLVIPTGYKLNPEAPSAVEVSSGGQAVRFTDGANSVAVTKPRFPLRVPLKLTVGSDNVAVHLRVNYCSEDAGVCRLSEVLLDVPVTVSSSAIGRDLTITHTLAP
jgi:thiol-disulfide isomerase/thioredoxin